MSEGIHSLDEAVHPFVGPAWFDRATHWLRERQQAVLLVSGGFHVLVLVTMIVMQSAPYVFGKTIMLRTAPVDPRDMFRGDYVTLSYDINRVPPGGIEGIPHATNSWWSRRWKEHEWLEDRTVYVTIEPDADGKYWHGVKVSTKRPTSGKYIRGKYSPGAWQGPLRFGIEAYYVQEGTGRAYEDAARTRTLSAEVVVAPWGQAKLKALHIDQSAGSQPSATIIRARPKHDGKTAAN